ncbi:MAG: hypothetical protein LBE44_03545 [Microbacterium hominis]|jgi:hypothetical protein|nr:hypothetical protein [Microbacterium hominis]
MKLKRSTASFHKSKQPEAKKYPAPFKKRAMYEAHEVRFCPLLQLTICMALLREEGSASYFETI